MQKQLKNKSNKIDQNLMKKLEGKLKKGKNLKRFQINKRNKELRKREEYKKKETEQKRKKEEHRMTLEREHWNKPNKLNIELQFSATKIRN